jgi:DNA-binding MarR family transcriptional regulator
MPEVKWTEKQGQYLAFIYNYTVIHGQPPSETDMQRFFGTSPPTVHQMVVRLTEKGLITREPGEARTIQVSVSPDKLPRLEDRRKEMAKEPSRGSIYQIKVTLGGSKPPIWRRIQVPGDVTLAELHDTLQAVMGWWDYHLHQFIVGETYYGVPHPDYMMEMLDESEVRLNEFADEGSQFVYEYDFGDSWEHVLQVEKVLPSKPGQRYPVCVKGRRATPPEDVGGIWGYELYLEAMADPDHPEHEMYLEWRGEFDPEEFNLDEVNAALRKLR